MDEFKVIIWSDGTKPERSCKEDNPEHKTTLESNVEGINKREHANNKLNEREMIKQVCNNPFLQEDNYHDIIDKQEQFLIPKNSNFE